MSDESKKLYQCEECKLFYQDPELAKRCEEWCRAHGTCNVEITKHAVGSYGIVSCSPLQLYIKESENKDSRREDSTH